MLEMTNRTEMGHLASEEATGGEPLAQPITTIGSCPGLVRRAGEHAQTSLFPFSYENPAALALAPNFLASQAPRPSPLPATQQNEVESPKKRYLCMDNGVDAENA